MKLSHLGVFCAAAVAAGCPPSPPPNNPNARESWVWPYNSAITFAQQMTAIQAHKDSFTHLSPTFYTVNLTTTYSSGPPAYVTCGALICSGLGTNDFGTWDSDTLTTQVFTTWAHAQGLKVVPAIYGGGANLGNDDSVKAILCNGSASPCTAQTNFVSALVSELTANDYDGYNLDWEVGNTVNGSYAAAFVAFVNALKAALVSAGHPNALVTADAIVSNVNGTYCSSNNGYLDFVLLQASSLDRMIIEDYTGSLQTGGNSPTTCGNPPTNGFGSAVLSTSTPAFCDFTFTGMLLMMCAPNMGSTQELNNQKAVIGIMPHSSGTNPIAGEAMSRLTSFGFTKVASWPEYDSASQSFMSTQGIVPATADWYTLMKDFLAVP